MTFIERIENELNRQNLIPSTGKLEDYYECIKSIQDELDRKILKRNLGWLVRFISYNEPDYVLNFSKIYHKAPTSLKIGHSYESYLLRYGNPEVANEKYKKRCNNLSEECKNSYAKLTEYEKRNRNVGCYEFYESRYGVEANKEYKKYLEKRSIISKKAVKKTHEVFRNEPHRCVVKYEYWLKKCDGDHEEAMNLYHERQSTNSLKNYIKRDGQKEGYKKWKKRQRKWLNTLYSKTDEEISEFNHKKYVNCKSVNNVSKSSIIFFDRLIDTINKEAYYGKKGNEISIQYDNTHRYYYDCYIPEYNLIIEYNGINFHPKPLDKEWYNNLSSVDYNKARYKDLKKKNIALNNGYRYIEVWSDDTIEHNIDYILRFIEDIKNNEKIKTPSINLP